MSRSSFRFAVPTTVRAFTGAQSSVSVARNLRVQHGKEATSTDETGLFTVPDATYASGTASGNFDGANSATWPPGTSYVGKVKGSEVTTIPDEVWGKNVVAMRLAGATVVDLIVSGDGGQGEITVAAPTTVGNHTAASAGDVSAFAWPAEAGWAKDATSADEAEIYLSDDETIAAGSGVPAGAQYVGRIVGGASALPLPRAFLATRGIVRRTKGTAARNVLFSGQGADANNIGGVNAYVNATNDAFVAAGHDVAVDAADNIAITAATGSVVVKATEGNATLHAGSDASVVADSGNVTITAGGQVRISPRGVGAGDAGALRLLELAANGTHSVGLRSPDTVPADVTFVLPGADGTAGQVLGTNGVGALVFDSPVKGIWGADAGLTNAAPQSLGAGSRATTSLTALGGVLQASDGFVSEFRVHFTGDAANTTQTITATLLKNGVAVTGATIAGIATDAGAKSGSVSFTPVALAKDDVLTVIFIPSAPLAGSFFSKAMAVAK